MVHYGLERNLASRWEGVRLLRASGKSPDSAGSSPNFSGSFSATSPEVLSLWNLTAIQGFPGSFPDFPKSSPELPRRFPDFPGGQPLLLGSLTPSVDSQKLPLNGGPALYDLLAPVLPTDLLASSPHHFACCPFGCPSDPSASNVYHWRRNYSKLIPQAILLCNVIDYTY